MAQETTKAKAAESTMPLAFPDFDEREIELLRSCLKSKWVTQGPMTQQFERLIAERHGVRHALATTSCTAALHLGALALKLKAGDEVIVPAFTWVTSAHCAEYVGARAVFADVDPASFNLSPDAFEAAITPRTRAVVVVHLFGLAAEMNRILQIARRHGLSVIEDAACAIGTVYEGRPVGGFGDLGCFSFHPRKVITTGEGGAVTTNDEELAAAVASLRNHGSTGLPPATSSEPHGPWTMATFGRLGFNLRLSDIQAAVGVAQMEKLDRLLDERIRVAARYDALLQDVEEIVRPTAPSNASNHTYQSYVIKVRKGGMTRRNTIMSELAARGIQSRPGTHAVHRLSYYRERYSIHPDAFPVAAASEDTTITLPLFPGIREEDQVRVVSIVRDALIGKNAR